jgi:ABC-type transporter Mla maintaining outer membrane lipid asymmetry permease subunit MlaE
MVRTWQVGVITFLIVSLVFLPIGVVLAFYFYKKSKIKHKISPEDFRKEYKTEYSKWV